MPVRNFRGYASETHMGNKNLRKENFVFFLNRNDMFLIFRYKYATGIFASHENSYLSLLCG